MVQRSVAYSKLINSVYTKILQWSFNDSTVENMKTKRSILSLDVICQGLNSKNLTILENPPFSVIISLKENLLHIYVIKDYADDQEDVLKLYRVGINRNKLTYEEVNLYKFNVGSLTEEVTLSEDLILENHNSDTQIEDVAGHIVFMIMNKISE